jgi:hypothetical protein
MRLQIEQFRKQNTVFEQGKLQSPKLLLINKFFLPYRSIVHFNDPNAAVLGPNQNDPIFKGVTAKIYIEHVINLATQVGNPRKTTKTGAKLVGEFRRQNPFFKPLTKDEALVINPLNVLVYNYNMLDPQWIYQANFKATYNRWLNDSNTYWENVASAHKRFGWEQFVEIHLPDKMPSLADFRRLSGNVSQQTLETINTKQDLNIWDLYRWLGIAREESTMAVVPKEAYKNIWFLIKARDRYVVLNMGALDEWRDSSKDLDISAEDFMQGMYDKLDETDTMPDMVLELGVTNREGLDQFVNDYGMEAFFAPAVMQRRVLSLLTAMSQYAHQADVLSDVDVSKLEDIKDEETMTAEAKRREDSEEDEASNDESEDVDAAQAVVDDLVIPDFDLPSLDFTDEGATYTPPDTELFATKLLIEPDAEMAEVRTLRVESVKAVEMDERPGFVVDAPKIAQGVAGPAYELYKIGRIPAQSLERAVKDATTYKTLPDPWGGDKGMEHFMTYTKEDMAIPEETLLPDSPTIMDKSMLGAKLKPMHLKYMRDLYKKDMVQAVMSVQNQGAAVIDYRVTVHRDAKNHYELHSISLKGTLGKVGTVHQRIPVIDEDGRFLSNGVTYRQRLQRGDLPIRKVDSDKVALTSYINKTFVTRSRLALHNYDAWMARQVRTSEAVTGILSAELDQRKYKLPRIYSMMGKTFRGFTVGEYTFYFKYEDRIAYLKDKYHVDVSEHETNGFTVIGLYQNKQPILVDDQSQVYVLENGSMEPIGDMVSVLGLDQAKAPLEAAYMNVGNKELPVGFVLCYVYGLTATLKRLGVSYARHKRGERIALTSDNFVLAFQDEYLVFNRSDYKAALMLGGFQKFSKQMTAFSIYDFERPDVYQRLLMEIGLTTRFTSEIDALFKSWVDPITEDLLQSMGEPTTYDGLLYRSIELLMTDWSPAEVDGAYMRYRGYERMAGTLGSELQKAVKRYNNARGTAQVQVQMDPTVVWTRICQDPTVMVVEDSNPLANIREQESMTYRGDGGRSTTSMVERTRIYGEADLGIISESTVDSGDVGVIASTVPDPNFISMRGTTRPFDKATDGPARQLSTCALLGVATTNDDAKRINFVSIQQQQGIYADGYEPTPLRTGYEEILAQRTTSLFAVAAEQDGVVTSVDEYGITVTYKDGNVVAYQLGNINGLAAGVSYPHRVITKLKTGQSFKRGETISYNERYFTEDLMTPGRVIWKAGVNSVVAFSDNLDTLEDGSVISERLAIALNTQISKPKTVTVRFDQDVEDLVKVGDKVDLETILCIIKDPTAGDGTFFDEVSRETLAKFSSDAPRAKVVGTISKIECFYRGERDDMSDSLRKIAYTSDKIREAQAKQQRKPFFNGQLDGDDDTMDIEITIDHDVPCGVGDKGVVANQMKTVFSDVMYGTNQTADGQLDLDLIFGNTSVEERMVYSPKLIATATILLAQISQHLVGVYRGTTNAKFK